MIGVAGDVGEVALPPLDWTLTLWNGTGSGGGRVDFSTVCMGTSDTIVPFLADLEGLLLLSSSLFHDFLFPLGRRAIWRLCRTDIHMTSPMANAANTPTEIPTITPAETLVEPVDAPLLLVTLPVGLGKITAVGTEDKDDERVTKVKGGILGAGPELAASKVGLATSSDEMVAWPDSDMYRVE